MSFEVIPSNIPEVLLLRPRIFSDERGYFFESYNRRSLEEAGIKSDFVQDNCSRSKRNVLRGIHYQVRNTQGKLIRAVSGVAFDVAVDLRKNSPTFGKWAGFRLDSKDDELVWMPPGFGHGFVALSDTLDLAYKVTDYYTPDAERTLLWSDPEIGINWQCDSPILSPKDAAGRLLRDLDVFL